MQYRFPLRRVAFLAFTMVCAAASGPAPMVASAPPGGASRNDAGTFLVARLAAMENNLPFAARQFNRVLRDDPQNVELRQEAFMANLLAGSPDALRLAALQPPGNETAQMMLGDGDALAGNWAAAEKRFAALPLVGMTQVLQPLLLAWSQQGAGDTDAALATLATYVAGQRFRGAYALHAALIADLAGRANVAKPLYQQAEAEFGGLNLQLGRQLASWQARSGDLATAHETLEKMIATSPDVAIALPALQLAVAQPQIRNARDGMAEAYLALAAALRPESAGQFSLILLRLALDMRPDLTSGRLLLADIDDSRGQAGAAIAALAPVPASDPLIALVRLRRAVLTDHAGKSDDALAMLVAIARDYPISPDPLAVTGDILRAQQHFSEAVGAYDKAVALLRTPKPVNWPLFFDRGVAEEQAKHWTLARADFLKALELSPDQPSVLNYLGYSWADRGQHLNQARKMIERAAELRPNDGAILDSLGWVALRQGDVARAIRFLERANELDPSDAEVNGHLGDAYYAAGRTLEARYQWLRALNLKPDAKQKAALDIKMRQSEPTPAVVRDQMKSTL